MSNNITLNIVEPGSGPAVPDTGLFTAGIGGPEATAIGAVIVLAIATIVVAILYKKQNKTTKLVHLVDSIKAVIANRKRITTSLTALALLASAGTFSALLSTANKNNTSALEGEDGLTLDISNEELTIELADEPVFAVLPVEVTVAEATQAGYTLTAYADNTDLVSTTDESKTIPMVTVDNEELVALEDNTYGLALIEPEGKDIEVYTPLSTDTDNPTLIAEKEEATEAEDTTTIYYAFYITPETPYGTYTSGGVYYNAEANRADLAKVTFDGNGLMFNDSETNITRYIPDTAIGTTAYSHTPNVNDEGEQDGMYGYNLGATNVYQFADNATNIHVKIVKSGNDSGCGPHQDDYFTFWTGSHPTYTAKADYASAVQAFGNTSGKYVFGSYNDVETDLSGVNAVTFAYTSNDSYQDYCTQSGYGYYAVITAQDADGNSVDLLGNKLYKGSYQIPSSNASYKFLGWSTDKSATTPTYTSAQDIALELGLSAGDEVTLYAIWQPLLEITYNGNGADSTINMDNVKQYTAKLDGTSQVDLLASNFQRAGYGFVGWSTDNEAWDYLTNESTSDDPTIYGPNQTITIDENLIAQAGENRKLVLNAVWAPAETNITMQTFDPTNQTYASKPNGTVIALKDERDNEVYAVAKLADGNWWMIENLRLDDEATISTTNTNNPVTVDNNVAIKNNDGNTSAHLSSTNDNWCTNNDSECDDQSYLNTNNAALTTVSPIFSQDFTSGSHANFDDQIHSYGNYYNWYSATAGNGTYGTGGQGAETVAGDLCPAGWRLPIGNNTSDNGSFSHLDVAMGGTGEYQGTAAASNRWRSFPNNFVYSGYWYGSSASSRGNYGYYWSSTASDTGSAYDLYFYDGSVGPGTNYSNKYYGYSVRCVAPVQ